MFFNTIFSRSMLVAVLLALSLWGAYNIGHGMAEAEGKAALAELEKAYLNSTAIQWEIYAQKEKEAREVLREETSKALALEADLLQTKKTLAKEREGFAKRINDATFDNDCILGTHVVRLYNEALYGPGYAAENSGNHAPGHSSGLDDSAGTPAPLERGVLPQPVTMRDLLAHAKKYGEWARELKSISLGWNIWAHGQWPGVYPAENGMGEQYGMD